MKILLISSSYLPHYGGLETVVREISTRMHKQGSEVAIITNRYPRRLRAKEIIDDISVTRMFFVYPTFALLATGHKMLWFLSWFIFPLTLLQLFLYIYKFRPDVINLHYPNDQIVFLLPLSYIFSFRLVVSLHGGDVDAEPYKTSSKLWLFKAITNRACRVTACSSALLKQAEQLQSNIRTKSIVIHNGVYTDLFLNATPYQHKRRYIVGVGRLEFHKGFDLLIDAFANVALNTSDVDVLIVGEGSQKRALQEIVEKLHLDSRVCFLGNKSREEVASLMKGASVVVIPSRREPFGIVALEAMASGRPIIASQVEGLMEALQGAEVMWFDLANVEQISKLLKLIISNHEVANSMLNREFSEARDWNKTTALYFESYRK